MSETPPRETLPPEVIALLNAYGDAQYDLGIAVGEYDPDMSKRGRDLARLRAQRAAARAALESSLGAMIASNGSGVDQERSTARTEAPRDATVRVWAIVGPDEQIIPTTCAKSARLAWERFGVQRSDREHFRDIGYTAVKGALTFTPDAT